MEMSLNVDPVEIAVVDDCTEILRTRTFPECDPKNRLLVEGLPYYAHPIIGRSCP
jgi:hypothetical protein